MNQLNTLVANNTLTINKIYEIVKNPIKITHVNPQDTDALKQLEKERLYDIYKTLAINGFYNKDQQAQQLAVQAAQVTNVFYNYAYLQGWTPKNGKYIK